MWWICVKGTILFFALVLWVIVHSVCNYVLVKKCVTTLLFILTFVTITFEFHAMQMPLVDELEHGHFYKKPIVSEVMKATIFNP